MFDNVFIPWEDVLVHRDIDMLEVLSGFGFFNNFTFQGAHLAVKLDFIAGLLYKALRSRGRTSSSVQMQIGEVIAWRNMFWAISDAMALNSQPWVDGAVLPNGQSGTAYGSSHELILGSKKLSADGRQRIDLPSIVGARLQEP